MAMVLAFLPFLRKIDLDYDRCAPLLLLPAFWLGRGLWKGPSSWSLADSIDRALLLLAAATALIASIESAHQARALVELASWSWIVAGSLLARRLAVNVNAMQVLLIGLVCGSTIGCLAVWAQWTDSNHLASFPYYSHGRLFGLHMMVGTLSGLVLTLQLHRHRLPRLAAALATTLSAGGMLWAGGRAPLIGTAVALLSWVWFSPTSERRALRRTVSWILVGGLVISLVKWSPQSFLGWWNAIERSAAAKSVSELSSTRLDFWQTTWREIILAPWIGHGADSYRFITPKLDGDQPHNWILQFLLDFGGIGGAALGFLLVRQAFRGLTGTNPVATGEERPANDHDSTSGAVGVRRGVAASFAGCLTAGLLDGVFYHSVLLLPTAMLAAIAGSIAPIATAPEITRTPTEGMSPVPSLSRLAGHPLWARAASVGRLWLAIAAGVLALHSYIYVHLTRLPVPTGPDATPAQILHAFPSTMFGLERWLDRWKAEQPETTLHWARWAQSYSDTPAVFHLYAAIMFADQDDFASADREMEQAVKKSHWAQRANLAHFRASIRKAQINATSMGVKK